MLDVVILENTQSISTDLRTISWDYIALLVGYKFTTAHVRDSVDANNNRFIRELLINNQPINNLYGIRGSGRTMRESETVGTV